MSEKILLVDDEQDFLDVMQERLESRGMQVVTCSSASKALSRVENELFDVVILDMQMPDIDGLETLKRIKDNRPELQVILLTGYATLDKGVEAIKRGAMDFIEKPADMVTLEEKIKKAKELKMLIVEKENKEKIMAMLRKYGV